MKHVYIMRGGENYYKVGVAVNVNSRLSSIKTSNPFKVELVASRFLENAETVESSIHKRLVEFRAEAQNEWFVLTASQVLELTIHLASHRQPAFLNQQVTTETLLARLDSEHADMSSKVRDIAGKLTAVTAKIDALTDVVKELNDHKTVATLRPVSEAITKPSTSQFAIPSALHDADELAPAALRVLRLEGRASTSLLQRRLSVGYARAARIMDQLEAAGYVGPADGVNPREVLIAPVDVAADMELEDAGYPPTFLEPTAP